MYPDDTHHKIVIACQRARTRIYHLARGTKRRIKSDPNKYGDQIARTIAVFPACSSLYSRASSPHVVLIAASGIVDKNRRATLEIFCAPAEIKDFVGVAADALRAEEVPNRTAWTQAARDLEAEHNREHGATCHDCARLYATVYEEVSCEKEAKRLQRLSDRERKRATT